MNDDEHAPEGSNEEDEVASDRTEGEAERPAQHAARHEPGGEEEHNPQGVTESTTWDTEEHSDAPGPFGTG